MARTTVLRPSKDAYGYTGSSTNNGSETTFKLGPESTSISSVAYMEFDFSSIPQGSVLSSATLRLYMTAFAGGVGNIISAFRFYHFLGSWQENTITIDNKPSASSKDIELAKDIDVDQVNTWIESIITSLVQKWIDQIYVNYGMPIVAVALNNNGVATFASKENATEANRPQMVLVYTVPAPGAPTNLSPTGGEAVDRATAVRLSWQHNPAVAGEAQSKFDLQWKLQGGETWNTVTVTTENQYYDKSDFPHGNIEWQVRTYDQDNQVSGYSAVSVFMAGDKPATPAITNPLNLANVTDPRPTVTWTSAGQAAYNLKVLDTTGIITLWETTLISTDLTKQIEYSLVNATSYKLSLRIRNADGLWSDYHTISITAAFVPPPTPTITVTPNNPRGSITVAVTNPAPGVGEPALSYNDIYRQEGSGAFVRIATGIVDDGSYTDYAIKSGVTYNYKARAVAVNTAYADSLAGGSSITLVSSQLALISDYAQYIVLNKKSSRQFKKGVERAMMQFAGREYPLAEFSEHSAEELNLSFIILTAADLAKLEALCLSRETLLYRDARGRAEFITCDGITITDEIPDHWTVILNNPARVSYSEVV
jgi:hypothetical protein